MLIISTLLFLVFTNTISCSASEDNSNNQDKALESYRYNHPPLFAPYDFPDSEKYEVRKTRDIEDIESKSYETVARPELVKLPSNDRSQGKNRTSVVKRRKITKQQSPSSYEEKIEVKQNVQKNDAVMKEFVTERPFSTSPSPKTVVPKTFTKRPPEFNPVMKKFRQRDPVVKIVEETNFVYAHNGNFHYSFEGADGTKVSSVGELKSLDNNKTGEAVAGEVFYTDNEGNDFSLTYTADENGYRPHGAHLPTPPPIPIEIARALKILATKTEPEPEPVTEATRKNKSRN
ncbi:unnamed protein product, partial [Brenthis ino]